jgi:hypothetical protein
MLIQSETERQQKDLMGLALCRWRLEKSAAAAGLARKSVVIHLSFAGLPG